MFDRPYGYDPLYLKGVPVIPPPPNPRIRVVGPPVPTSRPRSVRKAVPGQQKKADSKKVALFLFSNNTHNKESPAKGSMAAHRGSSSSKVLTARCPVRRPVKLPTPRTNRHDGDNCVPAHDSSPIASVSDNRIAGNTSSPDAPAIKKNTTHATPPSSITHPFSGKRVVPPQVSTTDSIRQALDKGYTFYSGTSVIARTSQEGKADAVPRRPFTGSSTPSLPAQEGRKNWCTLPLNPLEIVYPESPRSQKTADAGRPMVDNSLSQLQSSDDHHRNTLNVVSTEKLGFTQKNTQPIRSSIQTQGDASTIGHHPANLRDSASNEYQQNVMATSTQADGSCCTIGPLDPTGTSACKTPQRGLTTLNSSFTFDSRCNSGTTSVSSADISSAPPYAKQNSDTTSASQAQPDGRRPVGLGSAVSGLFTDDGLMHTRPSTSVFRTKLEFTPHNACVPYATFQEARTDNGLLGRCEVPFDCVLDRVSAVYKDMKRELQQRYKRKAKKRHTSSPSPATVPCPTALLRCSGQFALIEQPLNLPDVSLPIPEIQKVMLSDLVNSTGTLSWMDIYNYTASLQ